jgi:hypothetical protein
MPGDTPRSATGPTAAQLGPLLAAVTRRLAQLQAERVVPRIWQGDPTVWKDDPATAEIRDRLGWLRVADVMLEQSGALGVFAAAASRDFARIVLLGMGGSSLAPEVLWRSFGRRAG